jgi:GNAT superfamily N-acetyltransferase
VILRPPGPGDWGWVVSRHGALYAAEHGWGVDYEAFVARLVGELAARLDPSCERAWIACDGDERLGSVACVRRDARTAQLRLLLVEPAARGRGLGERLVCECLSYARAAGYARIMLWTVTGLDSSRRLYERHGFTLELEEGVFPYDPTRTEQVWSRAL